MGNNMEAPELLPCPFCGKSGKLIKGKRGGGFCVECQWCGHSTPNWRPNAVMARNDWNRRADLAAPSSAGTVSVEAAAVAEAATEYLRWIEYDFPSGIRPAEMEARKKLRAALRALAGDQS